MRVYGMDSGEVGGGGECDEEILGRGEIGMKTKLKGESEWWVERVCKDCLEVIDAGVEYGVGDVTGDIYCIECADDHVAITMVWPEDGED